jgi:hypothetical protein
MTEVAHRSLRWIEDFMTCPKRQLQRDSSFCTLHRMQSQCCWSLIVYLFLFICFVLMGIEFRALCMVGKHCTTWAMPSDRLVFERGSC